MAIKVEKGGKNDPGTLENQALRLVYLHDWGIKIVYCYGNNLVQNLFIEELSGKSWEDIFNLFGKLFSLKTVYFLGIEIIKRIQYIHFKHYIHSDIKPDNSMIGRGANKIKYNYIIDFCLSKKYYSISKEQHIEFCSGKYLIGTARYCEEMLIGDRNKGVEMILKIENIGYALMHFLLGALIWQRLKVEKNEDPLLMVKWKTLHN